MKPVAISYNYNYGFTLGISPYTSTADNPVMLTDPTGMDTISVKYNVQTKKWEIGKTILSKGDDVFLVYADSRVNDYTVYTFSAGKSGHRISVLNLEITKYGTLSVYHISGHTGVGANGYFISPGGSPGLQVGSNKRLPDNVYRLGFNMGKWLKPLIYVYYDATTKSFKYIAFRGIKSHPVYTNKKSPLAWGNPVLSGWTKGCFVIASDYRLAKYGKGYEIQYGNSIMTSQIFDAYLGAYKLGFDKGRPWSLFKTNLQEWTFIVKTHHQ